MVKLLPLKGTKALRTINVLSKLILGLKMQPAFLMVDLHEFYESFRTMTEVEKEKKLRLAIAFVDLTPEEVETMISFACDSNGIPYGPSNQGNLKPQELFEIILAVCLEIARIDIDLLKPQEKKN